MAEEIGQHVPGQGSLVSQPIQMRFNEILEGVRADISVKIFGEDFATLERLGNEVREVLEGVPGGEVEFDALGKSPSLEVVPNRAALSRYNLHAAEINKVMTTALGGQEVGKLLEGNRRFDIVVRLAENERQKLEDLGRLPVRVEGGLLPLGKVADFKNSEQVAAISREFGQRRAAIMVNLSGRDVQSYVIDAMAQVKEKVKVPPDYNIEFGGQFENLQQARPAWPSSCHWGCC